MKKFNNVEEFLKWINNELEEVEWINRDYRDFCKEDSFEIIDVIESNEEDLIMNIRNKSYYCVERYEGVRFVEIEE